MEHDMVKRTLGGWRPLHSHEIGVLELGLRSVLTDRHKGVFMGFRGADVNARVPTVGASFCARCALETKYGWAGQPRSRV